MCPVNTVKKSEAQEPTERISTGAWAPVCNFIIMKLIGCPCLHIRQAAMPSIYRTSSSCSVPQNVNIKSEFSIDRPLVSSHVSNWLHHPVINS